MKLKYVFSLLGLLSLLATGMAVVTVSTGDKRTSKIVRLSSFQNTESLILAAQVRLLPVFAETSLILVGAESSAVVQSWLSVLNSRKDLPQFDVIAVSENFGTIDGAHSVAKEQVLAALQNITSSSQRALFFLPTPEVLRAAEGSIAAAIKSEFATFVFSGLSTSREHEERLIWQCKPSTMMQDPLSNLGCLILQVARRDYRKVKNEKGPILGLVEKVDDFDYFILQSNLIL
jgi:hypothetical protein